MSRHEKSLAASAIAVGTITLTAIAGQPVPAPQADAVKRSEITPSYQTVIAELEPLDLRPSHPPIDQIPPMPMPTGEMTPEQAAAGPGFAAMHDASTGRTEFVPAFHAMREMGMEGIVDGGFNGVDGAESVDDLLGRSFGTMTNVDESAFPWRMNVKLVMEFIDSGNGNASYFVCSGSMTDPEVVLTAAHCVYRRANDSTGNDFGFANRIWVYPGWDGNGATGPNSGISNHFGWGVGSNYIAFTGYTQDGNYDWDVGAVRISRAAGMLTGWYGMASGGNCAFVQSETYNLGSYPSEGCGQTGLHNGRDQYYWSGTYDSCFGANDAQLNMSTTPGCFTAQWGGMSGGNSYYFNDNQDRIAHAVVSNSNNATFANHTKVFPEFATALNTFQDNARGSSLDLQALQYRATPTTILAGENTDTARVFVSNPTNNNPPSDTYGLRTFLSTNADISTFDTQLNDVQVTWNFPAMGNLDLGSGNVTIPKNTPTGTYWLGVVLDDQDAVYGNNDTDQWDAQQISVTGFADIVANTCSAPSGVRYHGDSISVSYSVENEGGDPSNSVTLDFYASTNTDISNFDTLLGSVNIGTFSGSQTKSGSVNLTIPTNLLGDYYIGYIASASDDYYVNQSNEAFDGVRLNIDGRADLLANYLTALDSQAAVGGSTDVRFNVQNLGTVSSGSYDVDVYASTNDFISPSDTLLGTIVRPSIGVGGSSTAVETVGIPAFMSPGNYYIGMIVEGGANENATSNNTAYDSGTVALTDCLVDFDNNGIYDLSDISAFISAFSTQSGIADLNNDTVFDLDDIVAFIDAFTSGCP